MGLQALRNGEQFSLQFNFLRHAQREASSLCLAGAPKGTSSLQATSYNQLRSATISALFL